MVEGSKKNALTAAPLKMKAMQTFEMSGTAHPMTQCHIPEDLNPQLEKCYLPLLDTQPSDSKAFIAVLTEMTSTSINRPSC
jgi:hypothetical protein